MATVLEALNTALHQAFASDERVVLLGEDILDPYGGAFKVTRGLSSAYPDRVITTPISEAGIVGVGTGLALRGFHPVIEIMFGDFLTLAADQLINHAAKFSWMYNHQVNVPLVVRTPMGGRRGYGPTHSQTLEKHFIGVPGLKILAPHTLLDPGRLLAGAIVQTQEPILFIENKLLYPLNVLQTADLPEFEIIEIPSPGLPSYAPTVVLRVRSAPPPGITLTAYGYMADLARLAMLRLAYEAEIFVELVIPSQLSPLETEPLIDSIGRTSRLVTAEEGNLILGWGAEIIARAFERSGSGLVAASRVAAADHPIPASGPLEQAAIPGVQEIFEAAQKIMQCK